MLCRTTVLTLGALTLAALPACGQSESSQGRQEAVESGSRPDSARVARLVGRGGDWKTDFSKISVPPEEIASGGPPKDGIPAIDNPSFESLDQADEWLEASDPLMVVEHDGLVKAYPLRILIWHEIVNDEVGGRPLTITYCPLCNTALVFERAVGDLVLDFGTTGSLRHSDLVMYDRQTETWWQQATGEAIVGQLLGTLLDYYPANTLAWETVKELYPNARVLSRQTGYGRSYGQNPYVGYDSRSGPIAVFFRETPDPRLPALDRVAALDLENGWAASFEQLSAHRVANDEAGDIAFVVFWQPGASSALDQRSIPEGRDVGQTVAFDRRLADMTLSFEWQGGRFIDRETGTTWDLAGRAVEGPLAGERLAPIPHGNHFWFAWAAFRPETRVWTGS
jgi:hypothetical protein